MLKRRVMRRGRRRCWIRASVVVVRRGWRWRGRWREEVRLERGGRVDMLVWFLGRFSDLLLDSFCCVGIGCGFLALAK